MAQVDVRTSLPTLETDRIQLQPSSAIAVDVEAGRQRVGHAFYYPDGITDALNNLDGEMSFRVGLACKEEVYGAAEICIITDDSDRLPIVLGEGSSLVMNYVLCTMLQSWRHSGNHVYDSESDSMTVNLTLEELRSILETLSGIVEDTDKRVGGVVFDVSSQETGQSIGPVLLRDKMIQMLLPGLERTKEETVTIGFGNVRPEDMDEVTMYVSDPSCEEEFRRHPGWGTPEPTGVAVGSAQVIHSLLCAFSPTWDDRASRQDCTLEFTNGAGGGQYFMLEVSHDEALQLVKRLLKTCPEGDTEETLTSP